MSRTAAIIGPVLLAPALRAGAGAGLVFWVMVDSSAAQAFGG
jgi:hypothetical protein